MVFTVCGDDDDVAEDAQPSTTVLSATHLDPGAGADHREGLQLLRSGGQGGAQGARPEPGPGAHTFTAEDNRFDTGSIAAGVNAQLTVPSTPGTYKVKCAIHPTRMTGELKVT